MKVSLFYELHLPRPWQPDSEKTLYDNSLDQLEFADELGFHEVWVTEHHFQEEKCHVSCPEVFMAALTQRTKRMRIGHGIAHMPPGINHPIRVAERVATLDLLSGGRVDFGIGEASSEAELGGFTIDPGQKQDMVREATQVAVSAMADTPFPGYHGKYIDLPPRNVVPKPMQRPHPPVWLACSRRQTVPRAAEGALGALAFQFVDPEAATEVVSEYYSVFEERAVPTTRVVNPNTGFVSFGVCAPTRAEAEKRANEHVGFFMWGAKHYAVDGVHKPGVTSLWNDFVAAGKPTNVGASASIGSPDDVRKVFERFEKSGTDQLTLIVQHGAMPHEQIMETLELVGNKVLPDFIGRDEDFVARKAERLAPAIEKVVARAPEWPQVDKDYVFTAPARAWGSNEAVSEVAEAIRGLEAS